MRGRMDHLINRDVSPLSNVDIRNADEKIVCHFLATNEEFDRMCVLWIDDYNQTCLFLRKVSVICLNEINHSPFITYMTLVIIHDWNISARLEHPGRRSRAGYRIAHLQRGRSLNTLFNFRINYLNYLTHISLGTKYYQTVQRAYDSTTDQRNI